MANKAVKINVKNIPIIKTDVSSMKIKNNISTEKDKTIFFSTGS